MAVRPAIHRHLACYSNKMTWWFGLCKVHFYSVWQSFQRDSSVRFYIWVSFMDLLVPDRVLQNCPDPGIQGASLGKGCEEGQFGQAKPPGWIQKGAVVESQQQWRKHEQVCIPTHSRHDTVESAANRVRTLYTHRQFYYVLHILNCSKSCNINFCV